jgi:hypothetical protein
VFGINPPKVKKMNQNQLINRYSSGPATMQTGNRSYNAGAPSPHAGGGLSKPGYDIRDQTALNKKQMLMKQLKSGGF